MGEDKSILFTLVYVAEALTLFFLGLGVAHYLGFQMDWEHSFLGLGWIILLLLSGIFLRSSFLSQSYSSTGKSSKNTPDDPKISRSFILAIALLASEASLTVLLISKAFITPQTLFIMVCCVIGMLLLSLPTIRNYLNGFQEILFSFMMVFFIPLFGFEIQAQDVHRMILMITVPLFSLRLSATLAYELATYATDIKQLNSTLLVRIGWQNGMFLHNILILFGFLLIILAVIFGMSVSIALPAMGGLILGLYQIWAMRKIAEGRKPIWRSLVLGDFSLYVLIVYLLTYSFWVR